MEIVGRGKEQQLLAERIASLEAERIAIYGLRRVGKTYLIRTFCKESIVFEFTGIHEAGLKLQLENFCQALKWSSGSALKLAISSNWLQAFAMLSSYIETLPKNKPAVIFFDEFPWIETPKSGFLKAFDHWWNSTLSAEYQNRRKCSTDNRPSLFLKRWTFKNRIQSTIQFLIQPF